MVEPCGQPRFVEEHLHELPIAREVRQDPLEADQLLEARGSGLAGQVHLRHSPGSNEAHQLVLADRRRHRARRCYSTPVPAPRIPWGVRVARCRTKCGFAAMSWTVQGMRL